jgi:hypothetical protein
MMLANTYKMIRKMMPEKFLGWTIVLTSCCLSCIDKVTFPDNPAPETPEIANATAKYLWTGPDYVLAVAATVKDTELQSLQVLNSEWQIDKTYSASGTQYILSDTFPVKKDVNLTKHEVEIVIRNLNGGVHREKVEVEDLSSVNQRVGYDPDLLPPVITVTAPTVNKFYGFDPEPVPLDIKATITENDKIVSVYVKIWGEVHDGTYYETEYTVTPSTAEEEINLSFSHQFELPGGKAGDYQFLLRAIDKAGNQSVFGANLIVGQMDRLYLSDAKNEFEVKNQGFDAYASADAWGIGTLTAMRKTGANKFSLDYYYRGDPDENIRFIAFMGNDRPFGTSSRTVNYTLDGQNVLAHKAGSADELSADLSEVDFKLPVNEAGYYTITVDVTARTINATPFAPTNTSFSDAALFPNYSLAVPYDYLAIIAGGSVAGTAGWAEIDNNAKLTREEGRKFIYSGEFSTLGGGNISFIAPKAAIVGNSGWFRLPAARAKMKDAYGDLVSMIWPVGASGNGANYGISLTGNKKYHATYDLITYRLRIVQVP